MKIEELCEHIRTKNVHLRVDNVTVETGNEKLEAHGTISVEGGAFKLRLTIHNGRCPLPSGIFTPEEFWKISGVIDDEIAFSTRGMPHRTESDSSCLAYSRATFHTDSLSLGKDRNKEEMEESKKRVAEIFSQVFPNLEHTEIATAPSDPSAEKPLIVSCEARLIRFPLIWQNKATETTREGPLGNKVCSSSKNAFHTIFEGCEFLLIQEHEDCLISIFPHEDTQMASERLETIFDAFLHAFAFVSGKDAWPQEVKLSTQYRTLKHNLKVPFESKRSGSALLTSRACAWGADFGKALQCATLFFLAHERLGETVRELLWLSRSATSSDTPHEVGTLALCSIFEGVVDLLDDHLLSATEHEEEVTFNEARGALFAACKELKANLPPEAANQRRSYDRLIGAISSAKFARFREKLPRLVAHLGLRWDNCFDLALSAWQKNRNAKAHGKLCFQAGFDIESQSRMAGAINLLLASTMGYKGPAVFSSVEDKYERI